jgi:hypothetical protein
MTSFVVESFVITLASGMESVSMGNASATMDIQGLIALGSVQQLAKRVQAQEQLNALVVMTTQLWDQITLAHVIRTIL